MKKLISLVLIVIFEIIICISFVLGVKLDKYDLWIETNASVDMVISSSRQTSVNGNQKNKTVSISYLENDAVLEFKNYYCKIDKGDTIKVKYNPDNYKEVIYPLYEEHCAYVKKRNIILLFSGAVCITLVMFWANRKEN